MAIDPEGYGPREGQDALGRLLEDARTLSPLGVERVAQGWDSFAGAGRHQAWLDAERAALRVVETSGRTQQWDALRNRLLGLTEQPQAMIAWREEHGDVGHAGEQALLGAALALTARPELDRAHARTLLAPMAEALPWLEQAL